ncbi:MAG TPA: hypothetical protein VFT71_08240, partial [Candidatus Nitrosocosmicus sp.]|nr:hypothetical protein [Candidatus Nitrosocosmicus sp.]
ADEKAKREADEKAKREADEKAKSNAIDHTVDKKEEDRTTVMANSSNVFDYYLLWKQIVEAYLQTMKEATSSYFRLLDFWSQNRSQK